MFRLSHDFHKDARLKPSLDGAAQMLDILPDGLCDFSACPICVRDGLGPGFGMGKRLLDRVAGVNVARQNDGSQAGENTKGGMGTCSAVSEEQRKAERGRERQREGNVRIGMGTPPAAVNCAGEGSSFWLLCRLCRRKLGWGLAGDRGDGEARRLMLVLSDGMADRGEWRTGDGRMLTLAAVWASSGLGTARARAWRSTTRRMA